MKPTASLIAFGRINYDGVVLTSINVKKKPGTDKTVTFSGSIKGSADDQTTTFLHKINQINDKDEDGKRLFQAETLTVAEAKKIINKGGEGGNEGKPLFCIHGFSVQPGNHLKNLNNLNKKSLRKVNLYWCPLFGLQANLSIGMIVRLLWELERPSQP